MQPELEEVPQEVNLGAEDPKGALLEDSRVSKRKCFESFPSAGGDAFKTRKHSRRRQPLRESFTCPLDPNSGPAFEVPSLSDSSFPPFYVAAFLQKPPREPHPKQAKRLHHG